jgi:hypothetical protein
VAEVLGVEADAGAAAGGGVDEDRFEEVLRQVAHAGR